MLVPCLLVLPLQITRSQQTTVIATAKELNVNVLAYSPLGHGKYLNFQTHSHRLKPIFRLYERFPHWSDQRREPG